MHMHNLVLKISVLRQVQVQRPDIAIRPAHAWRCCNVPGAHCIAAAHNLQALTESSLRMLCISSTDPHPVSHVLHW